jgi:transposase
MEAYSIDLRKRVLAACDAGKKTKAVAESFSVSPAWVRRLKQRRREDNGSIEPRPIPGAKPKLDSAQRNRLKEFVRQTPDATLEELRAQIKSELDVTISIGALWETLRAIDLPLKKSRSTHRSRTARTSKQRGRHGTPSN